MVPPPRSSFFSAARLMSDPSSTVDGISASLAGLSITGDHNTVVVVLGSPNTASGSDSQNAAPKAKAAAKRQPAARRPAARKRWYVIAYSPRAAGLVGIWHCSWPYLAAKLPGGQLFGSACRPCKGFDDEASAHELWGQLLPETVATVHVEQ